MSSQANRIVGPFCHEQGIRGSGYADPEGKQVMLVGIAPAREEMRTGVPMVGRGGKLADGILAGCGWSRDRVYVTNLLCYEAAKPTPEQIMECWPRLQQEVALVKPRLVILLGQVVTRQFFGDRPFSGGPKAVRGVLDWYEPWKCHLMPTYHPAALAYGDAAKFVANDLVRDFLKIREFFDYPPNPQVTFHIVSSVERAQQVLDNFQRDAVQGQFIALDIETPFKDEDETAAIEDPISCFSISDGINTYWFPGEYAAQLRWPLDLNWTFHNGAYDTITLMQRIGVLLPIKHDTMYMSYALDERSGVHALKSNARETEAAGFYEEEWGKGAQATKKHNAITHRYDTTTSLWDARRRADPAGFRLYNARDAAYTARLASRYYRRLCNDNMQGMYENLLLPAVNTYRLMQRHGLMVSQERVAALLSAWVPLRDQKLAALQEMVEAHGGPRGYNPNSQPQTSKFMYSTLRLPGGPSTGKESIAALRGMHPFVDMLDDYRHLTKAMGTYVVGLWPAVKQSTMRVHSWPKLHGTVGGRVAYFNPAINTIPRAFSDNPYLSKLKHLFVAPPGKVLISLDYKQAECWTAWIYSQDPMLLADLRSGDLHRQTAAYMHKIPSEQVTKLQRALAKNTTFGMFFGIGSAELARQNGITPSEAVTYINEWRDRYVEYPKYARRMLNDAFTKGEIRTITGRVRRYPCAGAVGDTSIATGAVNYPIQSTSHDYLMSSIVDAWPVVDALNGALVLDLHDGTLLEADEDNWQETAQAAVEIMQRPRFGVDMSLPVEVELGYSWGDLHEVEL